MISGDAIVTNTWGTHTIALGDLAALLIRVRIPPLVPSSPYHAVWQLGEDSDVVA
jgi:hypothetical protein